MGRDNYGGQNELYMQIQLYRQLKASQVRPIAETVYELHTHFMNGMFDVPSYGYENIERD